MKILIGGASGFIGKALKKHLEKEHQVYTLVRDKDQATGKAIFWDIDALKIETDIDFDVVINLAGENIASGRWTKARKEAIERSRVNATKTIARFFTLRKTLPKAIINASATGFYGSRGDETLNESSSSGIGFLADVCKEWEQALLPVKDRGIRTVFLRTGVVLGKEGGVIKNLMVPFKLCLGGNLGDGSQYMSWIDLEDVVQAVDFIIRNESLEGPVNIVSPNPVTNAVFTKELAKALQRPAFLPMPKKLARFVFGEMADELLLSSQRVLPEKLLKNGYQFRFPTIESSMKHVTV